LTVSPVSQEQHVGRIASVLVLEFDGKVSPDEVMAEANKAYQDLCSTSSVEAFIPVLALRRARSALRCAHSR